MSRPSSKATLVIIRGDTKSFTITFNDQNNDPIDITGATIEFMVKEKLTDTNADALIHKTITSHSNPTSGITILSLSTSDTEDLRPGQYYYDIQRTQNSEVKSSDKAIFLVEADVNI